MAESWDINPGVLPLGPSLPQIALLFALSTLLSSRPNLAHLWAGFSEVAFDSVSTMTPCTGQGAFHFQRQKSHFKQIDWLVSEKDRE